MKDVDIATYTSQFNYLATLFPGLVSPEYKKIDRYIWGFPQPIQGLVTASKPTMYDSVKWMTFSLTNQEIRRSTMIQKDDLPTTGYNKRKFRKDYPGKEASHQKGYWKR